MSTLYVDNLQPNLGSRVMAAGHVVQVLQATYATETQSSASTFTDTGAEITITPTSTSSKILVMATITSAGVNGSGGDARGFFRLWDGSSELIRTDVRSYDYGNSGSIQWGSWQLNYLDSPATTSAVTYKVQQSLTAGSGIRVCEANHAMSMQVMEIAQ